jgi:transposase
LRATALYRCLLAHLVVDRNGIPLNVALTAANMHDSRMLESMLDTLAPIKVARGRPRRRPHKLHADKAYNSKANRLACRLRGVIPRIARKGIESRERLGRFRWVVERTFSWLHRFRRLSVRYERRAISTSPSCSSARSSSASTSCDAFVRRS